MTKKKKEKKNVVSAWLRFRPQITEEAQVAHSWPHLALFGPILCACQCTYYAR